MVLDAFPDDWSRALCVAAHPDDIEYGLAGAVAKWTAADKRVTYLLVTRGEAGIDDLEPARAAVVREAEERASAARVGVEVVEFLDGHTDGTVEYGLPLRADLARAIRRHRPELVCTLNLHDEWAPRVRNTPDHVHVGRAVLDAARDAANRWVFPDAPGPGSTGPWTGVRWVAFGGSPSPTHTVDIGSYVEDAIESLRLHTRYLSALGGGFDPDAFLRASARAAGDRAGCEHAVELEVFGL